MSVAVSQGKTRSTKKKGLPRSPVRLRRDLLQLFRKAMNLLAARRFDKALDCFDRILREEPNNTDALFMRAQTLMNMGRFREAIAWAKRASSSKPNNAELRFLVAHNYYNLKRPFETIRHLRKALKINPDYSMARLLLARALSDIGRTGEARDCMDAGSIVTKSPVERLTHANVLGHLGRVEEATDLLLGQIRNGDALAESFYELTLLPGKHWRADDAHVIESLLAKSEWSADQRAALHFASARIADREGRYDDAFAHFKQGNAYPASSYDIAAYQQTVHAIIELFSPELFRAKADMGHPSKRPVFVIGLPRAGKSILESALCRHPQIHGAGEISLHTMIEGGLILGLDPKLPKEFEERIKKLTRPDAKFFSNSYLQEIILYNKEAKFILNTLPQNFNNVGILHILYPNAKYIHVKRSPMDTCMACYMKRFKNAHTYSQDLRKMGAYYSSYYKLMHHWEMVIPGKIFNIEYEEFVREPVGSLKGIADFLGVDADPNLLGQVPAAGRSTVEAGCDIQPVNQAYIGYWRNYERHLGPLIEALGDLADAPPGTS